MFDMFMKYVCISCLAPYMNEFNGNTEHALLQVDKLNVVSLFHTLTGHIAQYGLYMVHNFFADSFYYLYISCYCLCLPSLLLAHLRFTPSLIPACYLASYLIHAKCVSWFLMFLLIYASQQLEELAAKSFTRNLFMCSKEPASPSISKIGN